MECTAAKSTKEAEVVGKSRKVMGSVPAELPAVGFEFQVLGNVRPVECGLPLRDEKMFVDPGLVIVGIRSNVDGGELGDSVSGVSV